MTIPSPPVRHQRLIVTIFGTYCRGDRRAIPVSTLISMLGDLGYDAPGVRSAVSRLKAKGILRSVRGGGPARYEPAESVLDIFEEGDERIFAREEHGVADGWVLAVFSVPESMRDRRHNLRSELSRMGFGVVAPGVWIASAAMRDVARARLRALGLDEFVEFFVGDHLTTGDMRAKVASWWDLGALDGLYAEFLGYYGRAVEDWTSRLEREGVVGSDDAPAHVRRDAFRYLVPMLTVWRRFPYRDPHLAAELLPPDWKGIEAHRVLLGAHEILAPMSAAHVASLLDDGDSPRESA